MSIASTTPQTVTFRGIDDLALVADEWNRDDETTRDRPTILMLHGGGQNRFSWKNTGQILADGGYHVIALDSRGHGDSDRAPAADYSVEALCGDTLQVLYQIGAKILSGISEIAEVHLEANNRTWDTAAERGETCVFTDSRPPYGCLGLRLRR